MLSRKKLIITKGREIWPSKRVGVQWGNRTWRDINVMVYGSFANCRVRTANWISVVTICSLISHLSGNNVVTRQISPTMNKDGQIHLLATIAFIRHKYIHVLCGLSYPSMLFCLLFFSLFILKTAHRNPSAFNEKDSKIENLSRALVNHDKMIFF